MPPSRTKLLRSDQVLNKLRDAGLDDLDQNWLNNMCRLKAIPFTIVGRFRRFREDAIDLMIAQWTEDAS